MNSMFTKISRLFFVLGGLAISGSAFAEMVQVGVNGMVCGFCAQGITKKLNNTGAAENINVDLEKKKVSFKIKDGKQLDDQAIRKLLTDAGYTVVQIERSGK